MCHRKRSLVCIFVKETELRRRVGISRFRRLPEVLTGKRRELVLLLKDVEELVQAASSHRLSVPSFARSILFVAYAALNSDHKTS